MTGLLASVAVAVLGRAAARVDRVAAAWLAARGTLERPLARALLESLAERLGAKLEYTELP
ncbi:MAG TPA: hypothetical protein VE074_13930 [Jatrophihabitantaceae bacterium]|nr:hypothetical protein [Jatrophihabitantaceae bacterium]